MRSGRLYSSIGVGTVTMNTRQLLQVLEVGGERQLLAPPCSSARSSLERAVAARLELGDAVRLDVEPDRVEVLAELDGQRQADIAQTDDADAAASCADSA